jgi:CRISPR/Cas system CMR subunit Cmr4 (Cas7 group RAMP superfamily)
MNTIAYQIDFFSYWHASSGLAGGAYADLLVNKTREGLPYIPGRTLKGLLRELRRPLIILIRN